jgi:hypothetical protein
MTEHRCNCWRCDWAPVHPADVPTSVEAERLAAARDQEAQAAIARACAAVPFDQAAYDAALRIWDTERRCYWHDRGEAY